MSLGGLVPRCDKETRHLWPPFIIVDARERAIESLYRERYVRFRNTLATITGSYDSARDVVQEAFVRALKQRRSLRDDQALEMWVWRIALRTAYEFQRKRAAAETPSKARVEAMPVDAERDPVLADALRRLPARRRLLIFLHYYADLSYAQIAELCEVSEGTVGATIAQARGQLAEILRKDEVTA
jgi:RNA polymerase sigma-70 factor (ECF subfamily)